MDSVQGGSFGKQNTMDVVIDGALHVGVPTASVMVTGEDDLAKLPAYPAGTIAFTAGYTAMWQLGADGNWVTILAVSGDD